MGPNLTTTSLRSIAYFHTTGPCCGLGDGGWRAAPVCMLATPNFLAGGPAMDPVHVATLAIKPWHHGNQTDFEYSGESFGMRHP